MVNVKDEGDQALFKQHVLNERREERTLVRVQTFAAAKIAIASQCLIYKLLLLKLY